MYALFPQQAKDYLGRREDPYYDVPVQTVEVSLIYNKLERMGESYPLFAGSGQKIEESLKSCD